jgi:HD superfamily phosphodiesterase
MTRVTKVLEKTLNYFDGDVRRINHLLKVYGFSKHIGELEKLDSKTQETLEIAAILHDIGIKISEEKYNSSAGSYQQIEGPPIARTILEELLVDEDIIERVCYLIAHHHTYNDILGVDYQILVEADFIVNIYEDEVKNESIISIREKIFKTASGIALLNSLYKI